MEPPTSRHFTLHELGDGVYAAIANDGAWAICNAGIVDLGDRTLVFDTFVNQAASSDLRAAAEELSGRQVGLVVNSHHHSDHVKGNQSFPGARIIATEKTREIMAQARLRYETGLDAIKKEVEEDLAKWVSNPDDPDSFLFQGYDRGHLDGLPSLKYTLPNVTFDSRITFHGSKRSAELVTFGGGHTVSDALLYLPEARTAFLGDLLFVRCHPYLGDGDVEELLRTLDRIDALEMKTLVPGHGPVGTPQDVVRLREYIEHLGNVAADVKASGGGPDEAAGRPIDQRFADWKWRSFRKENLDFLFKGVPE